MKTLQKQPPMSEADRRLLEAARKIVSRCEDSDAPVEEAIRRMEALADGTVPRLILTMEGGLIQGSVTDQPMEILVVDYDIQRDVDQSEGELIGGELAYVRYEEVTMTSRSMRPMRPHPQGARRDIP